MSPWVQPAARHGMIVALSLFALGCQPRELGWEFQLDPSLDAPARTQGRAGELDVARWSAARQAPGLYSAEGHAVPIGPAMVKLATGQSYIMLSTRFTMRNE